MRTNSGRVMEMRDDTRWFHDKYMGNQLAILNYHAAVIEAAIHKAGSLENIKHIGRFTDEGMLMETLVQDGKRL